MCVQVSPVVMLTILDHYTRREEKQNRVLGSLLGVVGETGEIEVRNCFAVPHQEENDDVEFDIAYHQSMLDLYHKANPKELIIGWLDTTLFLPHHHPHLAFSYSNFRRKGTRLDLP